jgi:hypothetical protein
MTPILRGWVARATREIKRAAKGMLIYKPLKNPEGALLMNIWEMVWTYHPIGYRVRIDGLEIVP